MLYILFVSTNARESSVIERNITNFPIEDCKILIGTNYEWTNKSVLCFPNKSFSDIVNEVIATLEPDNTVLLLLPSEKIVVQGKEAFTDLKQNIVYHVPVDNIYCVNTGRIIVTGSTLKHELNEDGYFICEKQETAKNIFIQTNRQEEDLFTLQQKRSSNILLSAYYAWRAKNSFVARKFLEQVKEIPSVHLNLVFELMKLELYKSYDFSNIIRLPYANGHLLFGKRLFLDGNNKKAYDILLEGLKKNILLLTKEQLTDYFFLLSYLANVFGEFETSIEFGKRVYCEKKDIRYYHVRYILQESMNERIIINNPPKNEQYEFKEYVTLPFPISPPTQSVSKVLQEDKEDVLAVDSQGRQFNMVFSELIPLFSSRYLLEGLYIKKMKFTKPILILYTGSVCLFHEFQLSPVFHLAKQLKEKFSVCIASDEMDALYASFSGILFSTLSFACKSFGELDTLIATEPLNIEKLHSEGVEKISFRKVFPWLIEQPKTLEFKTVIDYFIVSNDNIKLEHTHKRIPLALPTVSFKVDKVIKTDYMTITEDKSKESSNVININDKDLLSYIKGTSLFVFEEEKALPVDIILFLIEEKIPRKIKYTQFYSEYIQNLLSSTDLEESSKSLLNGWNIIGKRWLDEVLNE